MAIRNELVEAITARYARSDRAEKARNGWKSLLR